MQSHRKCKIDKRELALIDPLQVSMVFTYDLALAWLNIAGLTCNMSRVITSKVIV